MSTITRIADLDPDVRQKLAVVGVKDDDLLVDFDEREFVVDFFYAWDMVLSDRHRFALARSCGLFDYRKMTQREIAGHLGLSIYMVRKLRDQARTRLTGHVALSCSLQTVRSLQADKDRLEARISAEKNRTERRERSMMSFMLAYQANPGQFDSRIFDPLKNYFVGTGHLKYSVLLYLMRIGVDENDPVFKLGLYTREEVTPCIGTKLTDSLDAWLQKEFDLSLAN